MLTKMVLVSLVSLLTFEKALAVETAGASKEFKSSKIFKTLKSITIQDGDELMANDGNVNCRFSLMSGRRLFLKENQSMSANTVGDSDTSSTVRIYLGANGETMVLSCEDSDGTLDANQVYSMLSNHNIVLKESIAKK